MHLSSFSRIFNFVFLNEIFLLIAEVAALTHYYTTTELGAPNNNAATGNPLKGFLSSPDWNSIQQLNSFPSSMEFYYVGLDKVMNDYNSFDWDTYLEIKLQDTASRNKHAILRFILDYPGENTYVPQFLIDGGLGFNNYNSYGGGRSPDYSDPNLKTALLQFIQAFGQKYDGDTRIGFVQVGLLGFWGEWHTYTGNSSTESWIPDSLKDDVVLSFSTHMSLTQVQVRFPWASAIAANFGLHDDSFAYETLDGEYNGGKYRNWFFWRLVESASFTDFWKTAAMGGEIYPDLQRSIFKDSYAAGTAFHQDFFACTNVTHATYMLNYAAFDPGYTGNTLQTAIEASQALGYAFRVTKVEISVINNTEVAISVEVMQVGVAPFYYPLALTLSCSGMSPLSLPGVELIREKGDTVSFTFMNVPADLNCLNEVEIALSSSYAYPSNPVKFSQGTDGTKVVVSLPSASPTASLSPTPTPTRAPVTIPTSSSCTDSPLRFRLTWNNSQSTRSCTWVSNKDTINRCAAVGVSAFCADTCGSCATCEDSSVRFKLTWNNNSITRTCTWVANKDTINRCNADGVSDSCRATCGRC